MNKIAVIMSVYKNDEYDAFLQAYHSIINQTYQNFNFYIYIDGVISSSINSFLSGCKDPRVIIIRSDKNKGLAFVLNEMINIALKTEQYGFIARMDADDISLPERLASQIAFMEEYSNVDVLGGLCKEFGGTSARDSCRVYLADTEIKKNIFKKCPFVHPTVMFRVDVFKGNQRYPVNKPLTEDICLWFELAYNNFIFANLNEVVLYYRINDATLLRRRGIKKAFIELATRWSYAKKMKLLNFSNFFYISAHFIVRLLPHKIFKILHKTH